VTTHDEARNVHVNPNHHIFIYSEKVGQQTTSPQKTFNI